MMVDSASPKPTQTARRAKYGLNLTVAVIAAVLIAIGLNVIVDRGFRRLSETSPQTTEWLRYDLTATRQYSLSPQTVRVLSELENNYTLVALIDPRAQTLEDRVQIQRVIDLVQEYGRYSPRLTVERINPATDVTQADRLYQRVRERFESRLETLVGATEQGRVALAGAAEQLATVTALMGAVAEDDALINQASMRMVEGVYAAFQRLDADLSTVDAQIEQQLDQPLPDYRAIRESLVVTLSQVDETFLTQAIAAFERVNRVADTPDNAKDKLLQAIERMTVLRETVRKAVSDLQFAEPVEAYDRTRTALVTQESVVILGPDRVRVVPLNEMFRAVPRDLVEQAGELELGFIGEEKLTGALLSMSMDSPPMVVFIQPGRAPAIGERGQYQYVAQRLRSASMRVEQWLPTGQVTQFGQMPAGPPPQAESGQKTIWIVLPFPPPDPSNPTSMMNAGEKTKITELLDERLARGDAAMVMLGVEPGAAFSEPNPILGWLEGFGLYPQLDRIVLRQVRLPDRRSANTARFDVTQWPDDSPITRALAGMPAVFVQASPIDLGAKPNDDESSDDMPDPTKPRAALTPLVVLRSPDMWSTSDLVSPEQVGEAPIDEATRRATFTVGVAAERSDSRLIVVTDPMWAMDLITSNASSTLSQQTVGLAEYMGAAFPGNAELFVNSVYWLAGLDELIAASPRTQDIRRIDAIAPETLTAWRWILVAGMPVLILVIGVAVWLVRRKG